MCDCLAVQRSLPVLTALGELLLLQDGADGSDLLVSSLLRLSTTEPCVLVSLLALQYMDVYVASSSHWLHGPEPPCVPVTDVQAEPAVAALVLDCPKCRPANQTREKGADALSLANGRNTWFQWVLEVF